MKRATILVLVSAFVGWSSLSAYEAPDYPYCRRIEDAARQARAAGLPGPYLFGIEVTHPFFGISLTASDGELTLGDSPFQQLVYIVLH